MKKITKLLMFAAVLAAAASCSSANKMARKADGVQLVCEPSVLEVVAGEVKATVSVTYPENYFHPKAILQVTPVIVYEGGEAKMDPFMYQGEKVKDNYKEIPSSGASITEKISIPYVEGMEKCYLELRGVVSYKSKKVNTPSVKVADGANTTYMLVNGGGSAELKADGYEPIIKQTAEGQILYSINSSEVRGSQLTSQSVKDFRKALSEIEADSRKTVTGTEIVAYASPDGGEKLNTKLSDKRSEEAGKVWNKVTGGSASSPELKSIGQDWEGFRDLVAKSDLEDKDLILRVLSMYSDPAMRENEIRNMAEIYQSLKGDVLPELRRARFIANVEYKNYTSEELLALVEENVDVLDETALLHAATLVDDKSKKLDLYYMAAAKFDSDRARFNIAATHLAAGDVPMAKATIADVKTQDAEWQNAMGVIALREGDLAAAEKHFKAAGTDEGMGNIGVVDILNGNYSKAAQELSGISGDLYNTVLAYILDDQLDKAAAVAKDVNTPDMAYLKAIIAARQGDATAVKDALKTASQDPELAKRAAKDIEFRGL